MPGPEFDATAFKAFRQREWEDVAKDLPALSDTTIFEVTARGAEQLLDAVQAGPGVRLLDVACGPGLWASAAVRRGGSLVGLDLAPAMVEQARKANPGVEFRVGDAEQLAFADHSFDAVTCNFGIQMLGDPERAMREALRVLRPGGRYAFTTWCPVERSDFFRMVREAIARHGDPTLRLPAGPRDFAYGTVEDCERGLREAGFVDAAACELALEAEFLEPTRVLDILATVGKSRALLRLQTPERRTRIESAIVDAVRAFQHDGHYRLAMPTVLARATRGAGSPRGG
ncbi:MAG TPA: methyltransferase domain-containing protein [Kofleriaceae bacterium]|nr:methyltransferase domain-containing protein [Kofleriaceae bacterium]